MSSNSSSKGERTCSGERNNMGNQNLIGPVNGDQSVSEAVSNISSPDYQDDDNLLSSKDLNMVLSDPSDSDSTILVSEAHHLREHRDHNRYRISYDGHFKINFNFF